MELEFCQIKIDKFQQPNYALSAINDLREHIDWDVKKVYYLTEIKENSKTGAHCHKEEKELFVILSGSCIAVIDRGNGLEEFKLEGPADAIYVGNFVWHHFKNFSTGTILLALSSTTYKPDRSDYVEDYKEYKKIVSEK